MTHAATQNLPDFTLEASHERIPERAIVCLDSAGAVKQANGRMLDLLGVPAEKLIGEDYAAVCSRYLQPRVRNGADLTKSIESGETLESVLAIGEGSERVTLHRYSSPVIDAGGAVTGRVEVFSDITVRRRFEQEILDRTNELAVLNAELHRAQEQLVHAAKLAALGEMSAGVAHHLNNVLGVILGNVQLAQRREIDPWLREKLEACELAAADGAKTVQRIRALARNEEYGVVEQVDLNEIVRDVIQLTEPKWRDEPRQKDLDVEMLTFFGDPPAVLGNPTDLREVFANIVINAVQAMPDYGGSIRIKTYADGDKAVVSIADTGIGMNEETKARLFDPFFTTRGSEGTGLGMSIADAIISKHNGEILVDSKLGKGTKISICLPAIPPEPVE